MRRQPGIGDRDARALGRSPWSRPENVAQGRGNSGHQPGHFSRNCNKKMKLLEIIYCIEFSGLALPGGGGRGGNLYFAVCNSVFSFAYPPTGS